MEKILHQYGCKDAYDTYDLLNLPTQKMTRFAGQVLKIKKYVIFEYVHNRTGEIMHGLRLETEDGESVGTSSKTFVSGMESFIECAGTDEIHQMRIGTGQSRNGQEFLVFQPVRE